MSWKIHAACDLNYCQRWRTSQGHGQSRTVEKW